MISQLITVSHKTVKTASALIWYTGSLILIAKGGSLLVESYMIAQNTLWLCAAVITALLIGILKGELIFVKNCRNNLERIDKIREPRLYQCFKPTFWVFMGGMIGLGAVLSRLSHGSFYLLTAVAVLDLSIASALLWSSRIFWKLR